MGDNSHISKIYVLLDAIASSKAKYIEVSTSEGKPIFKIKLIVEGEDMVELLDGFFDKGFKVKQISKENFDSFEGYETLQFNL